MARFNTRRKLGEMLIEAGLLSQNDIAARLAEQQKSGMKLGQYLIKSGAVSEEDILALVSHQTGIERYHSEQHPYDVSVESLVSLATVVENRVIPVNRKGARLLVVATPDPMNIDALDSIEIQTGLEVEPLICTEQEFEALCYAIYGSAAVDGASKQMTDGSEFLEDDSYDYNEGDEQQDMPDVSVDSLQEMADEAPVIRLVNSILSQAVRDKASDVHISPEKNYVQLRFRVDGKLREIPAPPKKYFLPIISRIKILGNMDIAMSLIPQDGRFSFKFEDREVHVRASSLPTIYGENMILRLLIRENKALEIEDLGIQGADRDKILRAIEMPHGMILSTGPTGSGKSTSLYAVLRRINKPEINIITLEDPVEYRIAKIRQVQLNPKAGMTFASGLRSILRQDPDVVMVGEIRDQETANIAVQAAMTGHLLLSTLHTNDSAGAITRLIEMGIEPFLVASTLVVSIAQRLIRRICEHCKEPYDPPIEAIKCMGIEPGNHVFYRGRGCPRCNQVGYSGRVGLFEVLYLDPMIQEMIMQRASSKEITREAVRAGTLRTLRDDAASKVLAGVTSIEEAASVVLV